VNSVEMPVVGMNATSAEKARGDTGCGRRKPGSRAAGTACATLCYMRTVTHREMRNQSGEILRRVADGETVQVTNHGEPAALIVPPGTDPLADLGVRGQMRPARRPVSSLGSIQRRKSATRSDAIVADVRGRW
jgi:prevent-host-death family protein